jgi:hypothetical protein
MIAMQYESTKTLSSKTTEGVRFTIARMTFGRRIDLMRRVRHLSAQHEFERAGSHVEDKLQASLTAAAIDELYFSWGLISIEGLEIDGRPALPETLTLCGPEKLCHEIIDAIKHECSLTEEERKN